MRTEKKIKSNRIAYQIPKQINFIVVSVTQIICPLKFKLTYSVPRLERLKLSYLGSRMTTCRSAMDTPLERDVQLVDHIPLLTDRIQSASKSRDRRVTLFTPQWSVNVSIIILQKLNSETE